MPVFATSPELNYIEDHGGLQYMGWRESYSATEVEMCDLLYGLVRFIKPKLIVETGSHLGHGTVALALATRDNGCGRIVTCEVKADAVETARARLKDFPNVDLRVQDSTELPELQDADFVFSDSSWGDRVTEYELVKPGCIFVVHDSYEYSVERLVTKNSGLLLSFGRGCGIILKR